MFQELFLTVVAIFLIFAMAIGLTSCTNLMSESDWNNGMCATCEQRFELRAVYKGLRYYVCPQCGFEVNRY